jgi:putative nucleotidyltransferase with HDIG domain
MDRELNTLFFRNRLARRILMLFVFCALLPILAFTLYSYRQIEQNLGRQNQNRLSELAKTMGMSIYERLVLLDSELSHAASVVLSGHALRKYSDPRTGYAESGFEAIGLVSGDGSMVHLVGILQEIPEIPRHLNGSKTLILTSPPAAESQWGPPRLFLCLPLYGSEDLTRWLVGEVTPDFMWGTGERHNWPAVTDFCIVDPHDRVLVSSLSQEQNDLLLSGKRQPGESRHFRWNMDREGCLAGYWTLFLKSRFEAENWTVILSQSEEQILAQFSHFKSAFILMTALSFSLVLFVSVRYIQKSLLPLENLKEGTLRISAGDFQSRIAIDSGDELEELGHFFNAMSTRLERQFRLMTTRSALDRSLLRSPEPDQIIRNLLDKLREHYGVKVAKGLRWDSEALGERRAYLIENPGPGDRIVPVSDNGHSRLTEFFRTQDYWVTRESDPLLGWPGCSLLKAGEQHLVVPVFCKQALTALAIIDLSDAEISSPEDCSFARQLADQTGIALANANTLVELERNNWGTMHALARAVDAKSPWTAGHSERVTRAALLMAQRMGLSTPEIEILHRGALLHDIGKLGIPARILDKPGKLEEEEFEIIKTHPTKGVTILEPIRSYAEVLPIVHQHHERFDGMGYPKGLKGESIHRSARILAVADAFDAMVSDRPYRKGWPEDRAIAMIREASGTQFDPRVVETFLSIAEAESMVSLMDGSMSAGRRLPVISAGSPMEAVHSSCADHDAGSPSKESRSDSETGARE